MAQHEFDAFLTTDKGIEHQQNIADLDFIVVLVRTKSNDVGDVAPLVDEVKAALTSARPGTIVQVPEDASS